MELPPDLIDLLREFADADGLDVAWMGNPPLRIDFMVGVPGGRFEAAWPRRVELRWEGVPVSVVGAQDLVELKRASGRPQDLVDAEAVEARLGR